MTDGREVAEVADVARVGTDPRVCLVAARGAPRIRRTLSGAAGDASHCPRFVAGIVLWPIAMSCFCDQYSDQYEEENEMKKHVNAVHSPTYCMKSEACFCLVQQGGMFLDSSDLVAAVSLKGCCLDLDCWVLTRSCLDLDWVLIGS